MKFAYKEDGTVTGLNRAGQEGELTGTCSYTEDMTVLEPYKMDVRFYTAPGGVLVAASASEQAQLIKQIEKDKALAMQTEAVEARKREENLKDFPYNGNTYVADQESIQATQNECLAQDPADKILTLRGTAQEGCWAVRGGGAVPYTAGEFIVFATKNRIIDDYQYQTRHQQVAEMVFERVLSDPQDRFDEYIRLLNALDISFNSDHDAFLDIITARKLIVSFVLNEIFMVFSISANSPRNYTVLYAAVTMCLYNRTNLSFPQRSFHFVFRAACLPER